MKKSIRKLKGGGTYKIRFPSVDWGEYEIASEIHCDAGQILTKKGNRAQIGICVFFEKTDHGTDKIMSFSKE